MKKIIGLVAVLACASGLLAGAPSADQFVYEWAVDTVISSSAGYDTLTAANDTTVLVSDFVFDRGWQYFLANDSITGTGADSVDLDLVLEMYDCDGNMIQRKDGVFTIAVDEGSYNELTVGEVYFGCRSRMLLKGSADVGSQVILNRVYIMKRRPIVWQKKW